VLHLLLWFGLLQPDGFAELTLVRYEYGFKPIQQFVVGDRVVVVADGGQLQSYSIAQTMSYVADKFIKIHLKDICVCAAPDQKFYSYTRNDWVNAHALQASEQLLCGNGKIVAVDAVETVHKKQRMHTFSVETSHIFCVTPYELIAHNIEPISTAGTAVLTIACPPAGIALAIGQAVGFGVLACVMYCKHRSNSRTQIKNDGCFTPDSRNTIPVITGCHRPIPDVPVVCDIKAGQVDLPKMFVHEIPEQVRDTGCVFPAELQQPVLHNAATTQTEVGDNKRYDGPIARNWKEFEENCPIGQEHGKKFTPTGRQNPKDGSPIRQLSEDIPNTEMFKKGHQFAPDRLHGGDHFEVWDKNRNWIGVANLDGSKNYAKSNAEKNTNNRKLPR